MDGFLKKKKNQVKTFAGPGVIAIIGSTCKHCKDYPFRSSLQTTQCMRGRAALAIKGPF